MSWMQRLQGPSLATTSIFSPRTMSAGRADGASVLASYQGPFREQLLATYERQGKVPPGTTEAARSGVSGSEIGRHVQEMIASGGFVPADRSVGQRTLGLEASVDVAADAVAHMSVPTVQSAAAAAQINPIYGGVMGQLLAQRGLLPQAVSEPQLAAAVATQLAEDAAPITHVVDEVMSCGGALIRSGSGEAAITDAVSGVVTAITRADRLVHFENELARALKLLHV